MVRSDRSRTRLLALLLSAVLQSSLLVSVASADVTPAPTNADPVTTSSSATSSTPSVNSPTNAPLAGGSGVTVANDNSLIVQYKNAPSVSTQSTIATSLSVQSSQSINISSSAGTFNAQILGFATPQTMATAETSLQANSNVVSVTPNLMVQPQVVPNDPSYGTQWAPAAMNLPAAWDATTGSSSTVVAVLDTGVLLTHPDLVNNLWTNPADGSHGYNYVDGNTNPTDVLTTGGVVIGDAGHGTHVAGIIGATGNNGVGVTGVNWHTSIMSLRVCGPRYGNTTAGCYLDWVLQALQYAYDHGAQVINESFGGQGAFAAAERDMITAISGPGTGLRKGALVVAAAGNSGVDTTTTPFYPADYGLSNLISVGALAQDGTKASFSNYGWNSVDVLAPGQDIYSTMLAGSFGGSGDYGYLSGTSMAAPEVSGLAALIFSAHPSWTPAQVKRDIIATSTWTSALAPYAFSGGIVNAAAALTGTGLNDTMRLHLSGSGLGSISIFGNSTCSADCNIQIVPQSTLTATGTPAANVTMTWTGSCAGVLSTSPCSYLAPTLRPNISATFNATGGSGVAQTPLLTSPDTLAAPLGSGPYGNNFVSTALTPSGNYRLKISHYFPPPVIGGWCNYGSSVTGGVTVEDNLTNGPNNWTEEVKFTPPALGALLPGTSIPWVQADNCGAFGFHAAISDDGKTVLIPISARYAVSNWNDPASDFQGCGIVVYKKSPSNVWSSGSLIQPASSSACFQITSRTTTSAGFLANINYASMSGDGSTALLSGLTGQVFTVNLTASTPTISAPYILPNSCVAGASYQNKVSSDGSLFLIGVIGCSDGATALLLANTGSGLSLIRSFNDLKDGSIAQSLEFSQDGSTIALSYSNTPTQVFIYEKRSGIWVLARTLTSADGLTSSMECDGISQTGNRLVCSDMYKSVGYSNNQGIIETFDRISSSWSLGKPVSTIAWSDSGNQGDYLQLAGTNGNATTVDGVVSYLRLGDGTYATNYLGETFTIPSQAFNNTLLPSISGSAAVGAQLSVSPGTWTGFTTATTNLQWYSCANSSDAGVSSCAPLTGSTSNTYLPIAGDVGNYLRVLVTQTQGNVVRQVFSSSSPQIQAIGLPAPTISSVSPTSGSTIGGTSILITGTGFVAGATVTIGGVSAVVGPITATTIAATTPASAAGAKDIVVTNPDTQSATGSALFTYVAPIAPPAPPAPAPTITSVTPTSGSTLGGTTITITGSGFTSGATVTIGGASATVGTVTSTTIAATTPAGPAGAQNIVVVNPDNQFATGTALFTYVAPVSPTPPIVPVPAPTITSISPTSGTTAGGTVIVITGTGFSSGATVTVGGGSAVVGTTTSTTIAVTTPPGTAGVKDVVITNTDHQSGTGAGLFTYITPPPTPAPAPTITSISPTSGTTAGGTAIVITGTGFVAGATVTIGGASATVGTITSTTIAATTPAGTAGAKDVVVTNLDAQSVTGTGLFTYVAPPPPPAPIFVPPPPVVKVAPTIQWNVPAPITSDTALSSVQLNASLSSPSGLDGTFTYSPAAGTTLPAGTQTLSVTFTPADQVHYLAATKSVSILVTPAPIAVTPTLSGLATTYDGNSKSAIVGGLPDGVGYSITYDGSASAPTAAGSYDVEVKVTTDGYFGSASGTLVIARANPVLTWPAPAPINSDQILGLTQLNATADVPGKFTYTPASGTILPIGNQTLSATFVPDDQNDYTIQQISVGLIVKLLPPIIVPLGTVAPALVTAGGSSKGVTVLTPAQIKTAISAVTKKTPIILIFSYVKPTGKGVVDQQLSATRANAVKAQIMKTSPKAIVVTKPMGGTLEPSCAKLQNTCIIIKVSS